MSDAGTSLKSKLIYVTRLNLIAASVALTASSAIACKGRNVLYADDFVSTSAYWTPAMPVAGGAINITAPAQTFTYVIHAAAMYDKFDMCADLEFPSAGNLEGVAGGLLFLGDWDVDIFGLNTLLITPQGLAYISRRSKGLWSYPHPPVGVTEIRTGQGAINTLRVSLNITRAHVFINEKKIFEARVVPRAGGGRFGFLAQAGKEPVILSFSRLKITELSPE
jgi:hypothetical protein